MASVRKNIDFLKGVMCMADEQRLAVLSVATQDQAKVIGDIAANVLKKNLRVGETDKTNLQKHRDFIRLVGSQQTSHSDRLQAIRSNPEAAKALILATTTKLARAVKSYCSSK